MKKTIILFTAWICIGQIQAQIITSKGTIITNNQDTLSGKLEYIVSGDADRCNFIREHSKVIECYRPDELKGFYIYPNLFFYSYAIDGKMHFARLLAQGRIQLYSYKNNLFVKNSSGQLSKLIGGEKNVELNGSNYQYNNDAYKFQLKQLTADSAQFDKIDRLAFDKNDIVHFVRTYNQEPAEQYSAGKMVKDQRNFGVVAGYSFNHFSLNDRYDFFPLSQKMLSFSKHEDAEEKDQNPFIGCSYRILIGKESSFINLGLNVEIASESSFNQVWTLADVDILYYMGIQPDEYTYTLRNSYTMNATSLVIPITYHHTFLLGTFRPYVDLGISNRLFPVQKEHLKQEIYRDNTLFYTMEDQASLGLYYQGLRTAAGFNYVVNVDHFIGAGVSFDYFTSFSDKVAFNKIRTFGFYISWQFR